MQYCFDFVNIDYDFCFSAYLTTHSFLPEVIPGML